MLSPLQSDALRTPRVVHGFFTRDGGVSSGVYGSLNCGIGSRDEREQLKATVAAPGKFDVVITSYEMVIKVRLWLCKCDRCGGR